MPKKSTKQQRKHLSDSRNPLDFYSVYFPQKAIIAESYNHLSGKKYTHGINPWVIVCPAGADIWVWYDKPSPLSLGRLSCQGGLDIVLYNPQWH